MKKYLKTTLVALSSFVLVFSLTSCNDDPEVSGVGDYTYNTYLTTKPSTWNTQNWQQSDEAYIPSFTEMGLYDTILNDTKDGYTFVTEMASEFPVDVTSDISDAEYDNYGYSSNLTTGQVWDINLNEDARWEDGTAINADTYVESLKRQLSPDYANFRADSFYASSLVVANAESYFKQGRETVEAAFNYIDSDSGEFIDPINQGYDGQYFVDMGAYTPYVDSIFGNSDNDTTLYTVINNRSTENTDEVELAGERVMDAVRYYCWNEVDHSNSENKSDWDEVKSLSDVKEDMIKEVGAINIQEFSDTEIYVRKEKGNTSLDNANQELYSTGAFEDDLHTFVKGIGTSNSTSKSWSWKLPLFISVYNTDVVDWNSVGIAKTGDYKFRLYLSQKISALNLKFSLSSNWIVNTELYDDKTTKLNSVWATEYATKSVDNYISYGPYKLTKYEDGKSFVMERNDEWYGYTDGKHVGQYQMTAINTQILEKHSTVVQYFEAGKLDDLSMDKDDMSTYGNSSRKTTTYESYTQKISFNSDWNALKARESAGKNKTILNNDNFRKGLSLAVDRDDFASNTAGSKGFTGLLNDLYLSDVTDGTSYRNTPQGKTVYGAVYDELGGDPASTGYATSSLAEAENGYNFAQAKYYVKKGIQEELESTKDGHLTAGDLIDLEIRVYDNENQTSIDMKTNLNAAFTKVIDAASAEIEGSNITFGLTMKKDEDYYSTAKNGGYDMIFSTWGGAAINPYGLMQVYCDSTFESTCEYGFKGHQDEINLNIDSDGDGIVETKSYDAWYKEMNNSLIEPELEDTVTVDSPEYEEWSSIHEEKLNILAGIEAGILNRFEAVPLVARGTSSLNSFKIENATKNYVSLVGYGGIRFLTFNYDDAGWTSFLADSNYSSDLYKN